jgi:hypothetical protein
MFESVLSTLWATAAVAMTWAVAGALIFGVGILARRALFAILRIESPEYACAADLWTGLASLMALLVGWSLVAPIGGQVWVVPAVLGTAGLTIASRSLRWWETRGVRWPWIALIALVVLGIANASLAAPTAYDSGLYHLSVIEWASEGGAQPGLANLHIRLGASSAHLLMAASFDVGPWESAGDHLANGFVATLLLLHILATLLLRTSADRPFSTTLALLSVPATVLVLGADASSRISSPSLDAPVFVLVLASGLSAAQAVERGLDPRYALGAGSALAVGLGTRPYLALGVISSAVTFFFLARMASRSGLLAALVVLPSLVIGTGVLARQAMLTGYPLFPLSALPLPVEWKIPREAVGAYRAEVAHWAREPGSASPETTASWDWLGGWLDRTFAQVDVAPAFAIVALVPFVWFAARNQRGERSERLRPAIVVLVPAAVSLIAWFWTAPDPRYALGWIWLAAMAAVALVAPPVPSTRDTALPLAAVLIALWAWATLSVSRSGDGFVRANGSGPLGAHLAPVPETRRYTTASGLVVLTPVEGDLCWALPLCTPVPDHGLRLRGKDVSQGFTVAPSR